MTVTGRAGIDLKGVSRRFGDVVAVHDVDLQVQAGEFLTLLGPSGCGKTTTLRMVAGLERNDSGTIAINGRLVSDAGRRAWMAPERREIGMVFQSYAIWPHMTVFENVAYPLQVRKRPRSEIRDRVLHTLRLVEMEAYADRPAPALSGGQQQRVAIARALAFSPQVLLMDEPLSNLDAKLREQMRTELRALQKQLGITTLYVTHDQEEAITLSDRIVVMHAGRILQVDTPERIFERPIDETVARFFGAPTLVAGRVESLEESSDCDEIAATVAGSDWRGRVMVPPGTEVGSTVSVVLRPDVLSLGHGEAGQPAWRGVLKMQVYRGSRRSLLVDTSVGRLTVDAAAQTRVRDGEPVIVSSSGRPLWAVPRTAAAQAEVS